MIDKELKEITDRLVRALSPVKIYLFGSFARNEERPGSDYDIYIVMPDRIKIKPLLWEIAYGSVQDVRTRPIDFVMGTVSGFENRKSLPTIEKVVAQEGLVFVSRIS